VPPCFDVYVWVPATDRASVLARFIERYVDTDEPGDPRFDALMRTFVAQRPSPGDLDVLAELQRDDGAQAGFSLYLRASAHHEAIVTITEEGDLVLGVGIDDPLNAPEVVHEASALMASLRSEFGASAAIAGTELAPPQSAREWRDDALVQLREGSL
jgi:hypothetical protein